MYGLIIYGGKNLYERVLSILKRLYVLYCLTQKQRFMYSSDRNNIRHAICLKRDVKRFRSMLKTSLLALRMLR